MALRWGTSSAGHFSQTRGAYRGAVPLGGECPVQYWTFPQGIGNVQRWMLSPRLSHGVQRLLYPLRENSQRWLFPIERPQTCWGRLDLAAVTRAE